jgi:hypothetical protein
VPHAGHHLSVVDVRIRGTLDPQDAHQSALGPGQLVWKFYVNGALRSQVTRLWSASGYQLYGETHRKDDQMAGGFMNAGTKAVFSGAQKENLNLVWSAVTTPAGVNAAIYGAELVGGTYYIWDKACAS